MNNISDVIEEFIMDTIGQESAVNLSRNELALFFNCAPSQINYVLSTRFTVQRGYFVESKRGGGGYIKVVKLIPSENYISNLILHHVGSNIDYNSALQILDNLLENDFINQTSFCIIKSAISPKALSGPVKNENFLRANVLKNVLVEIAKGQNGRKLWFVTSVKKM